LPLPILLNSEVNCDTSRNHQPSFIIIGIVFTAIATLGILRMPDLFLRMSMSTKGATLGVGSVLVGSIIFFIDDIEVATRATATLIFLLLTAPISAHMIGRAGYIDKNTHLWEGTHIDELKGHYLLTQTHILRSLTETFPAVSIDLDAEPDSETTS
jgi:multicomponent Na+:H+ antiporter subunit G